MDAGIVFPVVAVVLLTLLVIWRYGESVESAYNTFEYFRKLIGAILIALVTLTFLRSGNTYLFFVALILVVFVTVWFAVERPDQDLV